MGLTTGGTVFLILAVGIIIVLMIYTFSKVLRSEQNNKK